MIDTDFEQLNQKDMAQTHLTEKTNWITIREALPNLAKADDRLAYLEKRDKELAELLGDNLHAISTDRLTYFQKRDKVLTELEAYLKMKSEETETEGHKERQAHNYQNADDLFLQSVVYDDCLEQIELLETAI